MIDRELMQQALEALELHAKQYPHMQKGYTVDAITALRAALAEPQIQPCAGRNCGSIDPNLHSAECFEDYEKATGMNQWQGLTDGEIDALAMDEDGLPNSHIELARAIEAKLREKNA